MANQNCKHPISSIKIIETGSKMDIGEPAPKYWTTLGECNACGREVEIDYEFQQISPT